MRSALLLLVMLVLVFAQAEGQGVSGQRQTVERGGVTVSVMPLNLTQGGSATIDFKLVMDTHSGALPSDMIAFAELVGTGGLETPPFAWNGERGGHHLSGTLSFPSIDRKAGGVLTLVLKSADGRNDMRFEWKVPSKSSNKPARGGESY